MQGKEATAQLLADTVQSCGARRLVRFPGKERGGSVPCVSLRAQAEHELNTILTSHLFPDQQKSSSDFFRLAKAGTNIGLSKKRSGRAGEF